MEERAPLDSRALLTPGEVAVIHTGPGLFELGDRVYAVPLCTMWS